MARAMFKRGDTVTIRPTTTKATGCVPAGAPHVHGGTCSEIIATQPYPVPDLHRGQTGRVNCVDADTGAVVVDFGGGDQDEYEPSDVIPKEEG